MKPVERYRLLKERVGTPTLFLLASLLVTSIIALWNIEIIKRATPILLTILAQIWWVLLLVFALLFLSNLFLTPTLVKGWIGSGSGWRGWMLAVTGGILSSGPIYLWYPLLAELEQHGMRRAYTATFLCNRAVKPALLPLLIAYFGVTYTLILTLYMILFSLAQGSIIEWLLTQKQEVKA